MARRPGFIDVDERLRELSAMMRVRALCAEGLSFLQISHRLGVTGAACHQWLEERYSSARDAMADTAGLRTENARLRGRLQKLQIGLKELTEKKDGLGGALHENDLKLLGMIAWRWR